MADYNAKYRDSVFRSYFNDPVRLLSLCNAVLDTNYTNPDELNINTFEGIFFDKQKNDISCTIDNHFLETYALWIYNVKVDTKKDV